MADFRNIPNRDYIGVSEALKELMTEDYGCRISDREIIGWDSDAEQPTQAKIDAMIITLQEEYDAQEYARSRQVEYPSTGDQLDYIFHNGVAKWKTDMIEPVKAKYPKTNVWPGYGNPADL